VSRWIPLLVRTEDYAEFASQVAAREAKRPDEATPTVRHERQEPYPRRSGQIHRPAGKHGISDHTSTPLASNT